MKTLENTYGQLPSVFYDPINSPNTFSPELLAFNHKLSESLGLDLGMMNEETLAKYFSATEYFPGTHPIAMAYAGHQFGHFVPELGDGRAMLLGEFIADDHQRYDLHLKGSGRTRYSRRGDGNSALGPVLREYLVSEAMFALGIPTTRSLCAVRTGEMVYREELRPGGVLTRLALSHIRVGTFEYFARRGDKENLKTLADYTIARLYPGRTYLDFWKEVAHRQMELISRWMSVGFIHGVMNTDNMAISGETIDFGPCAFMDNFNYHRVFSSIDRNGRYAYSQQGPIALWNLARLAECLLPLMENLEEAQAFFVSELGSYQKIMATKFLEKMSAKLGLKSFTAEDEELVASWFEFMETHDLDFTLGHIDLERRLQDKKSFTDIEAKEGFAAFVHTLEERLQREGSTLLDAAASMSKINPMTIPRNHLIEKAIENSNAGNDQDFFDLLVAIQNPFKRVEELSLYQLAPDPLERVTRTFCGT